MNRVAIGEDFSFSTFSPPPVVVRVEEIAIGQDQEVLVECRLDVIINYELYQRIDREALFNLQPEARVNDFVANEFQPDQLVEIELQLKSELLPVLAEQTTTITEITDYLRHLNQEQPNHPLLADTNWLALNVKQSVALPTDMEGELKIGYSTIWQDSDISSEMTAMGSMLKIMADTFIKMGLGYVQVDDEPILEIKFDGGEYGEWTCFGKVLENEQFFLFYSVFPVKAPDEKHPKVSEFLTRVNYDLPIGNFEFNFDTGEIRYKTSIDVEGCGLNSALVKQATIANLQIMAQYLPEICAVIENNIPPVEAS